MSTITVPCATCAGTGWATHGDRHTETRQDCCRTCGGTGQVPARPGESRETSWPDAVPGAADPKRLQAENDYLRASLANSGGPCAYCALPRERWGECASGFPGCARGDDAMLCPHIGAELETREEVDALRLLLRRNEVRVGRERELLEETTRLLERARAAEGRLRALITAAEAIISYDGSESAKPYVDLLLVLEREMERAQAGAGGQP